MTNLTRLNLLVVILLCLSLPAFAQKETTKAKKPSFKILLKDGKAAFEQRDYAAAFDLLKNAATLKPTNVTANYLAGMSAFYRRDYKNASGFLNDVTKSKKYFKEAPKALLYKGLSLKSLGKYEQATEALDNYAQYYLMTAESDKKSAEYTELLAHIKGCTDAMNVHARHRYAKADNLGTNVNTFDNEQANVSSKGDLFLTVNTIGENAIKHYNNVTKTTENVKVNGLRNDQQISNFTFFDNDKIVFLTVKEKSNNQVFKQIYKADFANNEISNLQVLPAKINGDLNSGVSAKDPCFGLNERQQMVMYFSSNRTGTRGGFDIWQAIIFSNGDFSNPTNIGAQINGSYNEASPFFDEKTGRLYFSSDRPESMGGYDVYVSRGVNKYWRNPMNMGIGVNSPADDYGFRLKNDGKTAWVASNREGAQTLNYQGATDDLFALNLIQHPLDNDTKVIATDAQNKIKINGSVVDKRTRGELEGYQISLFEVIDGSPVLVDRSVSTSGYDFLLDKNKVYVIEAEANDIHVETFLFDPAEYNDAEVTHDIMVMR